MKILIIGANGMLGHVVKKYFEDEKYEVYVTTRRDKSDKYYFDAVENINKLDDIINSIKPNAVINCIGVLNKSAEENKSSAVLINSYLPHYIDDLSIKYDFKFVHISTDCVFDGKKGKYYEDSDKDAKSFYGKTKALGEIENTRNVTLRTSIIGPDPNPNGIGLFQWFMNQKEEVNGYTKVIWTGVTTIELAKQIKIAIDNNLTGLYHVVNKDEIDKYSLLNLFKKHFNKDIIINKDDSYVSNKSLIVKRKDYVFCVPTYEQMIIEMKEWMEKNRDLYLPSTEREK